MVDEIEMRAVAALRDARARHPPRGNEAYRDWRWLWWLALWRLRAALRAGRGGSGGGDGELGDGAFHHRHTGQLVGLGGGDPVSGPTGPKCHWRQSAKRLTREIIRMNSLCERASPLWLGMGGLLELPLRTCSTANGPSCIVGSRTQSKIDHNSAGMHTRDTGKI